MLKQTQEWDDEIHSILPDRAEHIVRELIKMARSLRKSSYSKPQLIFSDGSFVSTTDWAPNATTTVRTLLAQGEQPLGFIAPPRDFGTPFVCPWRKDDEKARAELCSLAQS